MSHLPRGEVAAEVVVYQTKTSRGSDPVEVEASEVAAAVEASEGEAALALAALPAEAVEAALRTSSLKVGQVRSVRAQGVAVAARLHSVTPLQLLEAANPTQTSHQPPLGTQAADDSTATPRPSLDLALLPSARVVTAWCRTWRDDRHCP